MNRFPNLASGGLDLARRLDPYKDKRLLVFAILSGGVPAAVEVAKYLNAPIDLVIIRRLLMPSGPGSQLCAVSIAGTMVVDEEVPLPATPSSPVEHFSAEAISQLTEREKICRAGRAAKDIAGETVILVDCAIRTGSTMRAAMKALRTQKPETIIAAVPVASQEGAAAVAPIVDELICLRYPEPFGNAGVWYKDFTRPRDDEIASLLDNGF